MSRSISRAPVFYSLRAGGTLVAIEASNGSRPVILHAGPDLPGVSPEELAVLATRQHAPGTSSVPLRGSMINEIGTGISGPPGLIAHRDGEDWAIDLRVVSVEERGPVAITLVLEDSNTQVAVEHELAIDPETGVLTSS
ncbi:MAG: alpha-galactosidase, partial [Pseudomonadota bacterium]